MKFISSRLPYIAVGILALAVGMTAVSVFGQETAKVKTISETVKGRDGGFCNNNSWSSDERVSVNEIREMTVAAGGLISVDGGQNGGIAVKGEDRGDIVIKACIQAWGKSEADAKAAASNIRIGTAGTIKAE